MSSSPLSPAQWNDLLTNFVHRYDEEIFQQGLRRMEADCRHYGSLEAWAAARGAQNASDSSSMSTAYAHGICLQFVYDVMDAVDAPGNLEWHAAVARVVKPRRLQRILAFCLPLERAHVLFGQGRDWQCALHNNNDDEQQLQEDSKEQDPMELDTTPAASTKASFSSSMDPRLYRLLYSPHFEFQKQALFAEWSRPQKADPSLRATTTS